MITNLRTGILDAITPSNHKVFVETKYSYENFRGLHIFFLRYTNEDIAFEMSNYIIAFRSSTISPNRSEIF